MSTVAEVMEISAPPATRASKAIGNANAAIWKMVSAAGPRGTTHAHIAASLGRLPASEASYSTSEALKSLRRSGYIWFDGTRGGRGVWIATGKIPPGCEPPPWFSDDGLLPKPLPADRDPRPTAQPVGVAAEAAAGASEAKPALRIPLLGEIDIDAVHRTHDAQPHRPRRRDPGIDAVLMLRGKAVCSLRSDGKLEIITDNDAVELDQAVTRTLFQYLDRISAAGLSARLSDHHQ